MVQLAASTVRGTSISRLQTLQQSYFRAVIPLREKLAKIEAVEAEQRRRVQANFPMTVTDFRAVRDKPHQLHICQFLMLEDTVGDKGELTSKRDAIMTAYQWAWRQVAPLCEEYAKDVSASFHQASSTRDTSIPGRLQGGSTRNCKKHTTCRGPTQGETLIAGCDTAFHPHRVDIARLSNVYIL